MSRITVRNLDARPKTSLRVRAARHGRSMEEETRDILRTTLAADEAEAVDLATSIRRRFAPLGGVAIPRAPREPVREPPDFKA